MKFKIVLILFLVTNLSAQVDPKTPRGQSSKSSSPAGQTDSDHEDDEQNAPVLSTPRGQMGAPANLQITPNTLRHVLGARYRGAVPATRETRFVGREDMEHIVGGMIYVITTRGGERIPEVPIRDLGGQVLARDTIQRIVGELAQEIQDRDFNRYVGLTTQRLVVRARQHIHAGRTNPRRRLPRELLAAGDGNMHLLLTGVHPTQLPEVEALLIRALEGTGPRGLNGNAGHLGEPERRTAGQLEVTPGTATPGQMGNRPLVALVGETLRPIAEQEAPDVLQNVLYLVTPAMGITMPIIDLQGQIVDIGQLERLRQEILERFRDFQFEHYIGQVTAGEHYDRTPETRAKEHARAGVEHPYRRFPFAIRRTNEQTGEPVQLHALFYNVHPDQIGVLETWLIEIFGGLNPLCWNSTPGSSQEIVTTERKAKRDNDTDTDGPGWGGGGRSLGGLFTAAASR